MRKNPFGKNLENIASKNEEFTSLPLPSGELVLLEADHSGRDEMNLAGNPFALLQAASKSKQSFIRYEWERRLPSGKIVTASWVVNGHNELGLPGPKDELLFLVLLQLTREAADENGVWPQTVHFSRYTLMERLGWSKNAKDYKELVQCFERLQAVAIQTQHAFWDARSKAPFAAKGFHILEDYAIAQEPRGRKEQGALPMCWFKWNDTLYSSFQAGNVRDLALDFVLSLDHPTTRRLFRFLDMHRKAQKPARREFTIGVLKLRDRLGMSDYKHASKVKEKLQSAHNELIERGYLSTVEYVKGKEGDELAVYKFGDPKAQPARIMSKPAAPLAEEAEQIDKEAAYSLWKSLSEDDKERLRDIARQGVEPAFWDRLERPDSPMGLKLWELVANEHPEAYQKQLEQGREEP